MALRIKRESTETNEGKLCNSIALGEMVGIKAHVVGGAVHWLRKAPHQYLCTLANF